jgi:hypothetical protein
MPPVHPGTIPPDVVALTDGDIAAVVPIITVMVKSYTRGRGFDDDGWPTEDLAAVIKTASARLAANGSQQNGMVMAGVYQKDLRSAFQGWTLAELAVLNRYRVRAQ